MDRKKVQKLIEERGLRKTFVAEQMEIEPRTLYRYLSGNVNAPPAMVKLMSFVLGVRVEDIAA